MLFTHLDDAEDVIRNEYDEMPGLQLTFWQAQRLWNLPEHVCDRALRTLIDAGFLARTKDGRYVRRQVKPSAIDAMTPVLRRT